MERTKALHLVQENNGHARAYVDQFESNNEKTKEPDTTSYCTCRVFLLALFLEMAKHRRLGIKEFYVIIQEEV